MKYYIDTEFLEGPQDKKILGIKYGQTKPTIDLISIGIVAEKEQEYYYAVSKNFNLKEAWYRHDIEIQTMYGDLRNQYPEGREHKNYWIRDNVLKPIFEQLWYKNSHMQNLHQIPYEFTCRNLKRLIDLYGKSIEQIAMEVKDLCKPQRQYSATGHTLNYTEVQKPEFYAYYADYDWVAFCWLFGKMIDLPDGFPMYCRDLKQMLDEMYMYQANVYEDMTRLEAWLYDVKRHPMYPKQTNEHHALTDARWNMKLHEFITFIKANDFELPFDGVAVENKL